jgi:UDP-N-acetylmuramoyl-tripeptide--D-alanyl-D-alanine ligase
LSLASAALTMDDVISASGGRRLSTARAETLAGVSIDSRTLKPGQLFVAIAGPRFDGHDFLDEACARGAAAALVHRDVPLPPGLDVVRVDDTTQALGRLAAQVRLARDVPVLAITGSTGKTTTKEMAAAFLETRGPVLKTRGNLNNQWGLPLTLLGLEAEHQAAVLELGMSAAGELRKLASIARPDLAVITNVAPVHLEFFDSVDAIAAAKAEILEGLRPGGVAVLNRDDPRLRLVGERFPGEVLWFGGDRRCDVCAEGWRGTLHGMRFDLRFAGRKLEVTLPLPGRHFVTSFLAAAAAALRLGVDGETIVTAAATFEAAAGRGQVLRLNRDVTLLDDSYNANPVAVEAAVTALALDPRGRRVAFLGDMLELGSTAPELHRRVGAAVAAQLDELVAVGPLSRHLVEGARQGGMPLSSVIAFDTSAQAAAAAASIVRPGDTVLVKGSRGIAMERVVAALLAHFGRLEARG